MMNQGCILVLKTIKKEAKDILVVDQGEAECHIVPSSMPKAHTTLVQPLMMTDRPSFTVFMRTSR